MYYLYVKFAAYLTPQKRPNVIAAKPANDRTRLAVSSARWFPYFLFDWQFVCIVFDWLITAREFRLHSYVTIAAVTLHVFSNALFGETTIFANLLGSLKEFAWLMLNPLPPFSMVSQC